MGRIWLYGNLSLIDEGQSVKWGIRYLFREIRSFFYGEIPVLGTACQGNRRWRQKSVRKSESFHETIDCNTKRHYNKRSAVSSGKSGAVQRGGVYLPGDPRKAWTQPWAAGNRNRGSWFFCRPGNKTYLLNHFLKRDAIRWKAPESDITSGFGIDSFNFLYHSQI